MTVSHTIELFRPVSFRWWLSGGHALDAHVGRTWRGHDDTDIAISRSDAPRLLEVLDGWDIHIGAAGVLTPWDGSPLDPGRSQNNLWCRPTPDSPWMIDADADADAEIELFAEGRSSQAWRRTRSGGEWVVRVPIPNSGRLISYRPEALLTRLLADAGQPVCTWHLVPIDDVECSIGPFLDGAAIDDDWTWPKPFVGSVASTLRELHQLPATGWGPLENRADRLHGTSPSASQGIVERWFHAPIWPFGDELAGMLDFGDTFVGTTA